MLIRSAVPRPIPNLTRLQPDFSPSASLPLPFESLQFRGTSPSATIAACHCCLTYSPNQFVLGQSHHSVSLPFSFFLDSFAASSLSLSLPHSRFRFRDRRFSRIEARLLAKRINAYICI